MVQTAFISVQFRSAIYLSININKYMSVSILKPNVAIYLL